jgi:hypothetical protein
MNRLIAAVLMSAAALVAAGCSSSSGNSPDVTPTHPTTGSLPGPGTATPAAPAANAALYQPAQGIFPVPVVL